MPLVFAAITPHPPLLIPAIGKDQIKKVEQTKQAMEELEQKIYTTKPQLIIVISPHTSLFEDSFSLNAHTNFVSSFEEFGDLSTKKEWSGTPEMAAMINEASRKKGVSVQLISQEKLDHGASVPLFYLTSHLTDTKILPIGYSYLNAMEHIRFGELLRDVIMSQDKRTAVIASGDLSHGLDKLEPGKENFDKKLEHLIKERAIGSMIDLDGSDALKQADECGYRSILILLGLLKEMDYKFTTHAYEHPFGVGYLTGSFSF